MKKTVQKRLLRRRSFKAETIKWKQKKSLRRFLHLKQMGAVRHPHLRQMLRKIGNRKLDDTEQKASPSDADGTKTDKNWKEVKVRWVLDEIFSEKDTYDGETPGTYVFDGD